MNKRSRPLSRRAFLRGAMAVSAAGLGSSLPNPAEGRAAAGSAGGEDLGPVLSEALAKSGLPAIAAMAGKQGRVVASGAAGTRKVGGPARVTFSDKFHLGSCTKAMTATLAGMYVEQGKLGWERTLAQVFPERTLGMHASYRRVTLEMLLTHRSGAPANGATYGDMSAPVGEQRLAYMDAVVAKPPEAEPGSRYSYSNAGYIMAGAMLERVSGKTWEELAREMLFKPLGMASAGFGPPSRPGETDQPWGHILKQGKFEAVYGDNPPTLGPAGTVHCNLGDYLKFAERHTSSGAPPPRLVKPETYKKLHTPGRGQEYAMGWLAVERSWAKGTALTHAGSNTMNYFVVWLAPGLGLSVAVAANAAGGNTAETLDGVVGEIIRRFAA